MKLQHYIGCQQVSARPMALGAYNQYRGWEIPADESPAREGYLIRRADGHEQWIPKEIFEATYLLMGDDPTRITEQMVDQFIRAWDSNKSRAKSTVVTATLANQYEIVESSSCVDPANYDDQLGTNIALKRIKDKVWMLLGFMLQTARYGIKRPDADAPAQIGNDESHQPETAGAH